MRELACVGLILLYANVAGLLLPANNMDIVFLVDSSNSISYQKWGTAKRFLTKCVESVDISSGKVKIGVIEYSTKANLTIKLGEFKNHSDFATAVDRMSFLNQRTNVSGAIRLAYHKVLKTEGLRRSAKKVMVVITNGESNTDRHLTYFESDGARRSGVSMFSIGVGESINSNIMQEIASRPYYYFVRILQDYPTLTEHTKRLTHVIFADNYPKKTIRPKFRDCTADVIFVVDVSAPWSYSIQATIKAIAISMLKIKRSPYRVLLIAPILSGGGCIKKRQGFLLGHTMKYVRNALFTNAVHKRPGARDIIILVSNHIYTEAQQVSEEIQIMKNKGVFILVLALGRARYDRVLRDAVSEPKTRTFMKKHDPERLQINFNRHQKDGTLRKFSVIANTCKISSVLLWSCSFEKKGPYKCNITDDLKGDFFWGINSGPTNTPYTGPGWAYEGQYYALMEASHGRKHGDKAIMYLPFKKKGIFCLSFHYNMFGLDMGSLDVFVAGNDLEHIVWRMAGYKGSDWRFGEVLILLRHNDKIGIRGTRGPGLTSDIGLDLLRIRRGTCVGDV